MTEEANALPLPVEPEVIYQSWDPYSGPPRLRVQWLDASDGWVNANKALIRGENAEPGDEFEEGFSWRDSIEGRLYARIRAHAIARDLGFRTRVIREVTPV